MNRMILEKRLKKLEEEVKEITPRDGWTEKERIAKYGKTLEQMTNQELLKIILTPTDEKKEIQQKAELDRMTVQELLALALCKKQY